MATRPANIYGASGSVGSLAELEAVAYTPLDADDLPVSTPADQGLDPMLVAKLYHDAAHTCASS